MDESKPAAAESSQDRSLPVCIVTTQHQIAIGPVRVGDATVPPVTAAWDLGVYIDADVTTRTLVTNTFRACFAALRQIRSVRQSLPQHALLTLIRILIITQLDQCNSVLVGTSTYLQNQLLCRTPPPSLSTRAGRQIITPLFWFGFVEKWYIERWSLTCKLSLSCARPEADG